MNTEIILLCVIVGQQIYFMREIQKLINKLMSASYYDYRVAQTTTPRQNVKKESQSVEQPLPDTLATLEGIF